MKNQIIMENEIIEVQNTVEAFNVRISKMQQLLQIAIDTMQSEQRNIANNDDSLYTVQEVSKILGLSVYTIKKDIKENRLKVIQRGSRNYVRQDELNEYLKS
jgi:excisionase family DNA binding protein